MAQTIGQRLKKEREQRGLSIADVAHDTRIHANTICGLEADDYSVFSSTTYARSFLQLYSRHLEIDATDALRDFGTVANSLNSGGFPCLASVSDAIKAGEMIHSRDSGNHASLARRNRRQSPPLFLTLVVCLLIVMIPVFYFVGEKANSLEEATSILKHAISPEVEADDAVQQDPKSQQSQPNNTVPKPTESVAAVDAPPSEPLPAPLPTTTGNHRFPRPLPESEDTPPESVTQPATPLKATPIDPKKSKTVQNGN